MSAHTPVRPQAAAFLLALAAALAPAAPAGAQDAPAAGLRLGDAVAQALEHNPAILAARHDLDAARAGVLGARAAYDTRLRSSVSSARSESRVFNDSGNVAANALSSRSFSYELGLTRELRGGVVLQPAVSLARADDPRSAPAPYAQAGASLGVVVPLGYNRLGQITRADEAVARAGMDSGEHQLRQVVAANLRDVVGAYWEYAAAGRRLEVHRATEARAARLLAETTTLVESHERPAADLVQLRANLASRRMRRAAAEQEVAAVQQRLGLLMGIPAAQAAALPAPGDSFPPVVPGETPPAALVETALANRAEVAVAELGERAARLRAEAARGAARPELDLRVELGYTGLTTSEGVDGMLSPLYRDIPGLNLTVQLSYQAALANRQARARRLQREAALGRERVSVRAARDQVEAGVRVAASALERSREQLEQADTAVRLFRTAVDNEKARYALGTATLIDVLLSEDNLNNALLGQVEGQLAHATALVRLRYETGTLVPREGSAGGFTPAAATTRP